MGSRSLAAHLSDVLQQCHYHFPLLHCLAGAGGSPQLRCMHVNAEDPKPARASGQHPRLAQPLLCSESAATLLAEKSFLVGRLSFPVPLLRFFPSRLLVTASACLLGQWPACLLRFVLPASKHIAPWPATILVCPECQMPNFQCMILVGLAPTPTGLHGVCLSPLPLSASLPL